MPTIHRSILVSFLLLSAAPLGCDVEGEPDEFRDYDNIIVECVDATHCWATDPVTWDAWPAAVTTAQINAAVLAGAWIPTRTTVAGDKCWRVAGSDNHVCIVTLGTAKLMGRPTSEVSLQAAGNACWFEGAWEYNAEAYGYCFGVLDGVAIQLDIEP